MSMSLLQGVQVDWDSNCLSFQGVSDAMYVMGKVSRGDWRSITIIGTRYAGWFAAFAEWLLGLTTSVIDEAGTTKHTSAPAGSLPNIQIVYKAKDQEDEGCHTLQVTDKVFDLRRATELVSPTYSRESYIIPTRICGRPDWNLCLSSAFGPPFANLMTMPTAVGEVIGSAAVLFEAIAERHPDHVTLPALN